MDDFLRGEIQRSLQTIDNNIGSITGILCEDFFTLNSAMYRTAISTSTDIIEPTAMIILVVCFLVDFLKITINMDILKMEFLLKSLLKFVFAKVCLEGSFMLLRAIYATGVSWVADIGENAASVGAQTWDVIKPTLDTYGWWEMIGAYISIGIIVLAIWGISLVIKVIAYARKFEILVYLAASPLPCAFLPLEDGGASRIPQKFILTFASVCLQGVFMVLSVHLFGSFCMDSISNAIENGGAIGDIVGELFIGICVLLMAMTSAGKWAGKVLDVA